MRTVTTILVAAFLMASVVGFGTVATKTSKGGDDGGEKKPDPPRKKTEKAPDIITDLTAAKTAGQQWQGNGLKMKFCWCPKGKFTMGSPKNEKGRFVTRSM